MLDVTAWQDVTLVEEIAEGARNTVRRGERLGQPVAVRQSRRTPDSLQWELELITKLDEAGFLVPGVVQSDTGELSVNGIVVQRWIPGHAPTTDSDWQLVGEELQKVHEFGSDYPQRPGSCTVHELEVRRRNVDADLDALPPDVLAQILEVLAGFADVPVTLIHGDPDDSNLRIVDGRVGLLDWDESRVDVPWHDLSNLGVRILDDASHARAERLSNAWEAVNGWVVEPEYARRRFEKLSVSP